MSKFTSKATGVTVSVDDSKDDRFVAPGVESVWEKATAEKKTTATKK